MRGALTPSAAQFCDAVAADPAAALTVAVVGPDRYGRERVAAALRAAWGGSGVPVLGAGDLAAGITADPASVAVVVEDAHALDARDLDALVSWTSAPGARCVLTHRPWPRSAALADVVRSLRRRPVVLTALDRTALAAHLRAELGDLPPGEAEALLDVVEHAVGGVPAWVDQLVGTWRADPAARAAAAATGEVPARVAERLAQELALLEDDVADHLLALAVGASPGGSDADVVAAAAASGLLLADGDLVPVVRLVLARTTAPARLRQVRRQLLRAPGTDPAAALVLARALAGHGRHGEADPASADALSNAADRALPQDPALAGALYEQARAAGAPPLPTISRQAEACALAGDSEKALLLADEVLARAGAAGADDLARCVVVAATVLAHRSLLTRSAELYRWSAQARTGAGAPFAVLAFAGVGLRAEAEAARALAGGGGAPTLVAGAAALMADGVLASLDDGCAPAALAALTSAAAMLETSARAVLLPDTPAALAALVALHSGDLDAARGVLTRAVAGGQGGRSAQPRHHLLLAWTAMVEGRLREAPAHVDAALGALGTGPLEPRDALVLEALRVGLARREGDVAALAAAWARGRQQLLAQPVDLYALLPLGELVIGAARLGEDARLAPHAEAARALLDRLGRPSLWSALLHWSEVQAAVLADDSGAAQVAAAALAEAASLDRTGAAAALADAGGAWLGVLAGEIDADAVESAARGLARIGRSWDACRLAGQAAVRTTDRKAMTTLLQLARGLADDPDGEAPSLPVQTLPSPVLSTREREVAALVVAGKTYREVGEELFLSPKTVEHHVARLRQRLGAQGRAELFVGLRTLLGEPAAR